MCLPYLRITGAEELIFFISISHISGRFGLIVPVKAILQTNCPKVSHELAHEFLRQSGFKNYKEVVHEIWDKHLFASLPYEYYDENYKKTTKNGLFATLDTSSIRL